MEVTTEVLNENRLCRQCFSRHRCADHFQQGGQRIGRAVGAERIGIGEPRLQRFNRGRRELSAQARRGVKRYGRRDDNRRCGGRAGIQAGSRAERAQKLRDFPADRSGDALGLLLALGHALRIQLAQPPARFRAGGEPFEQGGMLGMGAQFGEGVAQLSFCWGAPIHILIHGQDLGGMQLLKLLLLLVGQRQPLQGSRIRAPALFSSEERRQPYTEGLRSFPLKPTVDPHPYPLTVP